MTSGTVSPVRTRRTRAHPCRRPMRAQRTNAQGNRVTTTASSQVNYSLDLIEGLTPIHSSTSHSVSGSLGSAPHSRSTSSMRDGLPASTRVPIAATRARPPDDRPRHGPPSRASAAPSRAPQKNRQSLPQIGLKCLFSLKTVSKVPLALVGTT